MNPLGVKHGRLIIGFYLRHRYLLPYNSTLYAPEGAHLSETGSHIFMENIGGESLHVYKGNNPGLLSHLTGLLGLNVVRRAG